MDHMEFLVKLTHHLRQNTHFTENGRAEIFKKCKLAVIMATKNRTLHPAGHRKVKIIIPSNF